jgi:hypothetical protein
MLIGLNWFRIFYLSTLLATLVGCSDPEINSSVDLSSELGMNIDEPPAPDQTVPKMQYDLFLDVASPVALVVDKRVPQQNQLTKTRSASSLVPQDSCIPELQGQNRFADRIAYFAYGHLETRVAQLDYVASSYSLPSSSVAKPVSLVSHPMCPVSVSSLTKTLGGASYVPSTATISKINAFVNQNNLLRSQFLNNETDSEIKLVKHWSKFFMCLSMAESLGNPDSSSSISVAQKYQPAGYTRPSGVAFYEDPSQSAVSRLNIGLFQFTPNSNGNIYACLKQWNRINPSCSVNQDGSQGDMIKLFGSGYQTFNAFCGIDKIHQTFSVQVNTSSASSTAPLNLVSGKLKDPNNRCVSLHFAAGKSYNHFGPLQNTTGTNLEKLMNCVSSN